MEVLALEDFKQNGCPNNCGDSYLCNSPNVAIGVADLCQIVVSTPLLITNALLQQCIWQLFRE